MGSVGTLVCAHTEGTVDTLDQAPPMSAARKKQRRRTIKERRDIVEETLVPGASVARVTGRHDDLSKRTGENVVANPANLLVSFLSLIPYKAHRENHSQGGLKEKDKPCSVSPEKLECIRRILRARRPQRQNQ